MLRNLRGRSLTAPDEFLGWLHLLLKNASRSRRFVHKNRTMLSGTNIGLLTDSASSSSSLTFKNLSDSIQWFILWNQKTILLLPNDTKATIHCLQPKQRICQNQPKVAYLQVNWATKTLTFRIFHRGSVMSSISKKQSKSWHTFLVIGNRNSNSVVPLSMCSNLLRGIMLHGCSCHKTLLVVWFC